MAGSTPVAARISRREHPRGARSVRHRDRDLVRRRRPAHAAARHRERRRRRAVVPHRRRNPGGPLDIGRRRGLQPLSWPVGGRQARFRAFHTSSLGHWLAHSCVANGNVVVASGRRVEVELGLHVEPGLAEQPDPVAVAEMEVHRVVVVPLQAMQAAERAQELVRRGRFDRRHREHQQQAVDEEDQLAARPERAGTLPEPSDTGPPRWTLRTPRSRSRTRRPAAEPTPRCRG